MKLRPVSGKQCMRALEKLGYFMNNSVGSHRIYAHNDKGKLEVSVPDHKEVSFGVQRKIIRRVGLTVEEFYNLM